MLVQHVIETVATDIFGCGLRCLRKEECRSYNSQSDSNQGNMTCELSDHTRQTSPDNLPRGSPGFTYYGKGLMRKSLMLLNRYQMPPSLPGRSWGCLHMLPRAPSQNLNCLLKIY